MGKTDRKREIGGLLDEATKLSIEGPLHAAIDRLKELLLASPAHPRASALLSDIYARLARYDEATELVKKAIQGGKAKGVDLAELESQLGQLEEAAEALATVNKARFDQSFINRAIVPDGEGGYLINSLGFPGLWEVENVTSRQLQNGALFRLIKSLATVVADLRAGQASKSALPNMEMEGQISVIDDLAEAAIDLELVPRGETCTLNAKVGYEFLHQGGYSQIETIRRLFGEGNFTLSAEGERESVSGGKGKRRGLPYVLLISLGLASDYGVHVLEDRLKASGIKAERSHIRDLRMMDAYIEGYRRVESFDGNPPHVIAISITDDQLENVNSLIGKLRSTLPDAFVLIGGPTSQTAEQLACLVPDFDMLVKGDGDEVLPQIALILGNSSRSQGLSSAQIEEVKGFAGGILLRTYSRWICHNIHVTNVPSTYHLPQPLDKKSLHYWHTSRGCPYDCRFCARWTGKRYHCVTPWQEGDERQTMARRSAQALTDWLLARLLLEFDEQITVSELEARLEACRSQGMVFEIPNLKDRILIAITDDDFLVNRQRIYEFCQEVQRLGLGNYFEFSAISSVRSLLNGDEIDTELVEWLKQCNFRYLNLGTDGLSQATIDQNQKGYSLDRHVIPLNKYLKSRGFFVLNNVIFTTPYTTLPELVESLILYSVCPFPTNIFAESAIVGHIGTKFNNEDVVNQRFDWRGGASKDMGHYFIRDGYRVPKGFMEYALNGSIISYADPVVRDLAPLLAKMEPRSILEKAIPQQEVWQVITRWQQLPAQRPEMKALGNSIAWHQREGLDLASALTAIKEHMRALNLSSFADYYSWLSKGEVEQSPHLIYLKRHREEARRFRKRGDVDEAEAELKLMIHEKPWYAGAYVELIGLSLDAGKYAQAISYFTQLQLVEPDLPLYIRLFNAVIKSLNLSHAFKENRPLFHVPRYITISPLFYFIACVRELAGGKATQIDFPPVSPQVLDRLYDVLDRLTPGIIEAAITEAPFDIGKALLSGERVSFFGIPVHLEDEAKRLVFDYRDIDPQAPGGVATVSARRGLT